MASVEDETMKSLQNRLRQGVLNNRQNVNYRAKPTVNLRSLKSNLTGQIDKHHKEQSKTAVGQREKKNTKELAPKPSVSRSRGYSVPTRKSTPARTQNKNGGNSVFDRLRAKRDALGSRRAEVASAMKEKKRSRRVMGGHNVLQVNENNMTKVALQTSKESEIRHQMEVIENQIKHEQAQQARQQYKKRPLDESERSFVGPSYGMAKDDQVELDDVTLALVRQKLEEKLQRGQTLDAEQMALLQELQAIEQVEEQNTDLSSSNRRPLDISSSEDENPMHGGYPPKVEIQPETYDMLKGVIYHDMEDDSDDDVFEKSEPRVVYEEPKPMEKVVIEEKTKNFLAETIKLDILNATESNDNLDKVQVQHDTFDLLKSALIQDIETDEENVEETNNERKEIPEIETSEVQDAEESVKKVAEEVEITDEVQTATEQTAINT